MTDRPGVPSPSRGAQRSPGTIVDRSSPAVHLAQLLERTFPILIGLVALSWILVAVAHVGDRALLSWSDGARMGLADSLLRGTFYPPLFDGSAYGGTRFMPIPAVLHAALASLTGELVVSGKLMTYLSFGGLTAATFAAMRSLGCSRWRSAILIAAIVATGVAARASLGISHDPLPLALQLTAVLIVTRSATPGTMTIAGVLCSAAFLAKLSALWAPAAIALWLLARNRRLLRPFLASAALATALGFAAILIGTDGRFAENLRAMAASGVDVGSALGHMIQQVFLVATDTPLVWALLPLAGAATVDAVRTHRFTIFHLAYVSSLAIMLVVLLDRGASFNHFLDPMVLGAVVIAEAWARWEPSRRRTAAIAFVAAYGVIASLPLGLGSSVWQTLRALSGSPSTYQLRPLEGLVRAGDRILSEDPTIPLVLGERPVVLDPFMLRGLAEQHPEWVAALVDRISAKELDRVILLFPLDEAPDDWYQRWHLGPAVVAAISESYVLLSEREGFAVYGPAEDLATEP